MLLGTWIMPDKLYGAVFDQLVFFLVLWLIAFCEALKMYKFQPIFHLHWGKNIITYFIFG